MTASAIDGVSATAALVAAAALRLRARDDRDGALWLGLAVATPARRSSGTF
jgi:hypothetical protein